MTLGKFLALVTPDLYRGSLPEKQSRPLRALVTEGLARGASLKRIAYVLASAHHETGRFLHLEEIASGEAYEGREKTLGNTEPGDGPRFKGRGYIQITGRDNYTRMSSVVGVDLVADPDAAMLPDIACVIAWHGMSEGTFTGRKLADYITPAKCDFISARRIVNGDVAKNGALIAGYADAFLAALIAAGVAPTVQPAERSSPAKSTTLQASAGQIATGASGVAGAVGYLEGTAQIIAIVGGVLVVLLGMWIMRERLRAWADGWR